MCSPTEQPCECCFLREVWTQDPETCVRRGPRSARTRNCASSHRELRKDFVSFFHGGPRTRSMPSEGARSARRRACGSSHSILFRKGSKDGPKTRHPHRAPRKTPPRTNICSRAKPWISFDVFCTNLFSRVRICYFVYSVGSYEKTASGVSRAGVGRCPQDEGSWSPASECDIRNVARSKSKSELGGRIPTLRSEGYPPRCTSLVEAARHSCPGSAAVIDERIRGRRGGVRPGLPARVGVCASLARLR